MKVKLRLDKKPQPPKAVLPIKHSKEVQTVIDFIRDERERYWTFEGCWDTSVQYQPSHAEWLYLRFKTDDSQLIHIQASPWTGRAWDKFFYFENTQELEDFIRSRPIDVKLLVAQIRMVARDKIAAIEKERKRRAFEMNDLLNHIDKASNQLEAPIEDEEIEDSDAEVVTGEVVVV